VPHRPHPRQSAFLLLNVPEALYGGAAGGGKTDALLMAALQYADQPAYSALLLRRTFPELTQAEGLIPRSHEWLGGSGAMWNGDRSEWTFPNRATLRFGHLQYEKDVHSYQGGAYQFVGFDELTHFTEAQYRYLFSRMRRLAGSNIPVRMRAGSNPDGPGHSWVKRWFLTEPPQARGIPEADRDDEQKLQAERVFLPARLHDNPSLDRESYLASLNRLDPYTRAMLLRGDWDADAPGKMFERGWFEIVQLPPADVPSAVYWDLAATAKTQSNEPDWSARVRAWVIDGVVTLDVYRMRGRPFEVEQAVRQHAQLDGTGVPIYLEEEPGASGKTVVDHYRRGPLFGWAVHGDRPTGSKAERWRPVSTLAQAGCVRLVEGPFLRAFLDEAESNPGGEHDDMLDAAAGAVSKLAQADVWAQAGYGRDADLEPELTREEIAELDAEIDAEEDELDELEEGSE